MKAIVRKTWETIEVVGKPVNLAEDEFVYEEQGGLQREFDENDLIVANKWQNGFMNLYAAMDRDGIIGIFYSKPKKDELHGIWTGQRFGNLPFLPDTFGILSWDNAEAVECEVGLLLKTNLKTK